MKARLDGCTSQVPVIRTVPTSEGKKLKLELPLEQTLVSTEESVPESAMDIDRSPVRSTRKVITVTKRTYRTAGGIPTESSTTVTRVLSDGTLSEGIYMCNGQMKLLYFFANSFSCVLLYQLVQTVHEFIHSFSLLVCIYLTPSWLLCFFYYLVLRITTRFLLVQEIVLCLNGWRIAQYAYVCAAD